MSEERIVLEVGSEKDARARTALSWGLDPEDLIVKVIDEEKAFFGLFGRKLRVEVRPCAPMSVLKGRDVVREIVRLMDLDLGVQIEDNNRINLSGEDAAIAIGKYGDTIKSLEYISNLMTRHAGTVGGGPRIRLDSDGYRERRELSLDKLAKSAASESLKTGRTVYLESMSSWERRLVHMALQGRSDVETRSVGVDPDRKVAIRLTQEGRRNCRSRKS